MFVIVSKFFNEDRLGAL